MISLWKRSGRCNCTEWLLAITATRASVAETFRLPSSVIGRHVAAAIQSCVFAGGLAY